MLRLVLEKMDEEFQKWIRLCIQENERNFEQFSNI